MPPVQTTYNTNIAAAIEGAIANMRTKDITSASVESAAAIDFGKAVSRGTKDGTCVAYATATPKFLGVTIVDRSVRAETPNGFGQFESARILVKGAVWVKAAVAVAAGDKAYLTATGTFSNVDTDNLLVGEWDTTVTAGGLAVLVLK